MRAFDIHLFATCPDDPKAVECVASYHLISGNQEEYKRRGLVVGTTSRILRGAAVSTLIVAVLMSLAPSAEAATTVRAPAIKNANCTKGDNSCYAGYTVSVNGVSSATTTFTVPTITCGTTTEVVVPSMILGDTTGANFDVGGAYLKCNKDGVAHYGAIIVIDGTQTSVTDKVAPGDMLTTTVSATTSGSSITIKDTTAGWTKTVTGTGFTVAYADAGDDWAFSNRTAKVRKVPTFSQISFSQTTVGGAALGTYSPTAANRTIKGTVDITTSVLNKAGTGFTTTFDPK
jgi:hypothetical protein